ncbi:MAG: ornithine cyclodeaminase family protein [Fimbriimonadaceae bacterium]|nr:ornithine cyclodeaminase family protein [Fimbriimonadaceae bacterium]
MARPTLVLTRADLAGRIGFEAVIPVIETCLAAHERGEDLLPPKLIVELPGGIAACLAGYTKAQHALTLKCGQERAANRQRELPTIHAHVLLYDPDTGELLMICEGLLPTVLRTAAAAAVAAKHLARPDSRVATVIGAGQLGRQTALAAAQVSDLEQLWICDALPAAATALATELRAAGLPAAVATPAAAVAQSDLVYTCTNSTQPIVPANAVRPGTHLSCMGADLHTKIECAPDLLPRCRLYADSIAQCTARGEASQAIAAGLLPAEPFVATLGAVIAGTAPGRRGAGEITLYDGTGLGVQDTAIASLIYRLATDLGLGTAVRFGAT